MTDLAFVFRDRRDEVTRRWTAYLESAVSDDYREVLESPIGARLVRKTLEDLLSYNDAEDYQAAAALRQIGEEAAAEAGRRATLGFYFSRSPLGPAGIACGPLGRAPRRACDRGPAVTG